MLNTKQIADLNALNQKIAGGYNPNATDTANLNWAKSKGYEYKPRPAGSTKISGPSGLQGLDESQIYRSGIDIYQLPKIDSQVDLEDSTPDVPEAPTVESMTESMMEGVNTGIAGTESIVKNELTPSPAEAKIDPITERVQTETDKFAQKPEDFQTELDKYKFGENFEELQKIMPRIAQVQAEYNKLAEDNRNRPIASRIIGGTADRIQRQSAVELAGLSAVAQAYQGNAEMALDIAGKMVDIKYEPIQMQIDNQKWQLDQVYSQLGREDKRKADALSTVIAERERLIADEKEQEVKKAELMTTLAQAGADTATLEKIMKAENVMEAVKIAAPFLKIQTEGTVIPQKIGTDSSGNDLFYDPVSKTIKTSDQLASDSVGDFGITSPSGNAYDMSTYATDEGQPMAVQKYIDEIGKFNSVEEIDAYIQSKYPNSPITGDMIAKASAEFGIGWEELTALMQHESNLGTSNVAKNNNNLGGITWNANFPESMKGTYRGAINPATGKPEGGHYVKFNTIQDGINSTAYELQKRKVDISTLEETTEEFGEEIMNWARNINQGRATIANVPAEIRTQVSSALQQLDDPKKTDRDENVSIIGAGVLRDVERALAQVNKAGRFSGFFAEQIDEQGIPTLPARLSPAFELQQHLESVKSNISIEQLQKMREASPTGGALGQVPVRQQQYLMQVLGSLSTSLKPEVLKENLNDIYNIYLDAIFGDAQELDDAVADGRMDKQQADEINKLRKPSTLNEIFGMGESSIETNNEAEDGLSDDEAYQLYLEMINQ